MRGVAAAMAAAVLLAVAVPCSGQPSQVSYQGQLNKDGAPFTGTAAMKFAIVSGTTTLWSNDGTSTGGGEPTAAVNVPVASGVFTVQLGAPPMVPLTSVVLGPSTDAVLRVWVDTGSGLEQLSDQAVSSAPFALQSGWTINGSDVFHAGGRVGIGTSTPGNTLDVIGGAAFQGNHLYIRNPIAPAAHQTWGFVVSSSTGAMVLGRATDIPPSGGSVTQVVVLRTDAPANSLIIDDAGKTSVKTLQITGGSDLAEPFDVSPGGGEANVREGMVVSIDPDNPGQLRLATKPYDRKVAGVISGANGLTPGMVMRSEEAEYADGTHNVALTGRVWCWADASEGAIEAGDMLTTSATPGHAMKATDRKRAYGAVIGKAMSALEEGKGLVLVLVNLQ